MAITLIDSRSREFKRFKKILEDGGRFFEIKIKESAPKGLKKICKKRTKHELIFLIKFKKKKSGLITRENDFVEIKPIVFYLHKSGIVTKRTRAGRKIVGNKKHLSILKEIKMYL